MSECMNPECGAEIIGAGVCVSCANSDYLPKRDGVDV